MTTDPAQFDKILCRFKAAIEIGAIRKSEGGDKFILKKLCSFGDLPFATFREHLRLRYKVEELSV